jgi:hypothetical protein
MSTYNAYIYIAQIDDEVEVEVGYFYQPRQVGDLYTEPIEPYIELETFDCLDPRITPGMIESNVDEDQLISEIWDWLGERRAGL